MGPDDVFSAEVQALAPVIVFALVGYGGIAAAAAALGARTFLHDPGDLAITVTAVATVIHLLLSGYVTWLQGLASVAVLLVWRLASDSLVRRSDTHGFNP